MKTIITADIHGCSLELTGLLRKTGLDRDEDTLVILGDLFDRGRHSYEVFQIVKRLREEMGDRFILVRGNHDQFLIDYTWREETIGLWSYNGGKKTLESFRNHDQDLKEVRNFLLTTPLYYETDQFIGVHAGLVSEHPEENPEEVLLWDRNVTTGAYRGKLGIGGHTPMQAPVWFTNDGTSLILDYDRQLPLPSQGFICLDTGCVFGRALTAMVIEGDEYHLVSMEKKDF